jgi:site-specific DNA-cytosine methylase
LQRHIEASGKARKGAPSDAEGGARGGCWWDGGQVSQTLDAVLSKGQTMPEKNRFPAVLQPVAHAFYSTGGTHGVNQHPEVSPAVKVGSGLGIPSPPAVATSFIPGNSAAARSMGETEECCVTIKGDGGGSKPHVQYAMTVRRLTPRECERLQGFPDDYTLIPWRKKQAEDCPDGPRYRALGNSMACNCMAWIGEKIAKWEAEHER